MSDSKVWVKFEKSSETYGRFTMAPLRPGMGVTIGNSLRRVLLSSLGGHAITSVVIEGVQHEFSTIPNVVEDVIDIICNLRGIIFRCHSMSPKTLKIDFKGKGVLTAKDIQHDSEVEIINPTQHIAELTKDARLRMELTLEHGFGYSPSEAHRRDEQDVNTVCIDASFSPILRVNPQVDKVRVGKALDHDSLMMEVWTNGSVSPEDAVRDATKILIDQLSLFNRMNDKPEEEVVRRHVDQGQGKRESALSLSIEDLELSARSLNCLKKAGIDRVADLIERDLSDLIQIKNFGKKSAEEINEKLKGYGLALKGVSRA